MLNGQNFVIDRGNGEAKYGFYTTQFVEANSKADAENIVIDAIKNSIDIKTRIKNLPNDQPMMYAEDIEVVECMPSDEQASALSWFKESF